MKENMSPERLNNSYCDAAGIDVKDVRVSSSKDDFVRVSFAKGHSSITYLRGTQGWFIT